ADPLIVVQANVPGQVVPFNGMYSAPPGLIGQSPIRLKRPTRYPQKSPAQKPVNRSVPIQMGIAQRLGYVVEKGNLRAEGGVDVIQGVVGTDEHAGQGVN